MTIDISYHITDFKYDDENIKILELGEAFDGSDFLERGDELRQLMLMHAAKYGSIKLILPVCRSFRHGMNNGELSSELPTFLEAIKSPSKCQINIVQDARLMRTVGMECIQERHDAIAENATDTEIVLGGAVDTFYLCDRNKRILNKILELNGLQQLQPETWFHDLDGTTSFTPPSDIPFFIIKPMKETLGHGVLLVSNEELPHVLQALKTGEEFPNESVGDIDYYRRGESKQVLIQHFYPGQIIQYQKQDYRPTGRAVFAVIKEGNSVTVEILDIFWQLPNEKVQNPTPTISESISSIKAFTQIAVEEVLYQQVKELLHEKLSTMSRSIYQCDIKAYLFKLFETGQLDEIKYYLDHYAHVRVSRLDQEFVALILEVDKAKAQSFLVEQAEYYAFPWHLKYKNNYLKTWVEEHLGELELILLKNLQAFFKKNKQSILDSPRKDQVAVSQESDKFITKINETMASLESKQRLIQKEAPIFWSKDGQDPKEKVTVNADFVPSM